MKKNFFRHLALSLILTAPTMMCLSCSEDSPTVNPPAPQATATLYYVEGYLPATFSWTDILSNCSTIPSQSAISESATKALHNDIFVGVKTDPKEFCSWANLPNAQLHTLLGGMLSDEEKSYVYRTYEHRCTTLPDTFSICHYFSMKENLTGTESKDFGIWMGGLLTDGKGHEIGSKVTKQAVTGVQEGKEDALLLRLSKAFSLRYIVNRTDDGSLTVTTEPYYKEP